MASVEHQLPNVLLDQNSGHVLHESCWCKPEVVYVEARKRLNHKPEKGEA